MPTTTAGEAVLCKILLKKYFKYRIVSVKIFHVQKYIIVFCIINTKYTCQYLSLIIRSTVTADVKRRK